jgi:uncharacterized alpha-E superfamily protein
VILSRVADALYWMGRYLERAENVTRLLLVTDDVSTELQGLDEDLARAEWRALAAVLPGPPVGEPAWPGPGAGAALALAHLRALTLDPAQPYGVLFSLRRARENARTVREAITLEVFVTLNETYRELEGLAGRPPADRPALRAALSDTHRGILGTVGAIEHTLSRDAGWLFLKLGESLERVYRTAVILRARVPDLLAADPKQDLPLAASRWRGLLRGLSSLENYRQAVGARIEPADILRFVVFDAHMPRSLRYGVGAVKGHLEQVAGRDGPSPPGRIVGRLAAELEYGGDELLAEGDCVPFLERVLGDLSRAHDAVSALYFGV